MTRQTLSPLDNVVVVELGGVGPVPLAGMILRNFGAHVVRVSRPGSTEDSGDDMLNMESLDRGKKTLVLDLKQDAAVRQLKTLLGAADVVLEGFRPGVAERLGLGPDDCARLNPALIYGRMTGWGQQGPYAQAPGHDLNYLALSGLLHGMGNGAGPTVPVNYIGDFGGGGLPLAMGVLAALFQRGRSGAGAVIDAAMVDGAGQLGSLVYGWHAQGQWIDRRMSNIVDGACPFYRVYETRDGGHVAIGAIEDKFYDALVRLTELDGGRFPDRWDRSSWAELTEALAGAFLARTRDEWAASELAAAACVTPVLSLSEAPLHPHNAHRGGFERWKGGWLPAPAPRMAPLANDTCPTDGAGETTLADVLRSRGLAAGALDALLQRPAGEPTQPADRTSNLREELK